MCCRSCSRRPATAQLRARPALVSEGNVQPCTQNSKSVHRLCTVAELKRGRNTRHTTQVGSSRGGKGCSKGQRTWAEVDRSLLHRSDGVHAPARGEHRSDQQRPARVPRLRAAPVSGRIWASARLTSCRDPIGRGRRGDSRAADDAHHDLWALVPREDRPAIRRHLTARGERERFSTTPKRFSPAPPPDQHGHTTKRHK